MVWPLVVLVATPVLAGLGSVLMRERRAVDALQCVQAGALIACALLVFEGVVARGSLSVGILLQTDALSAWLDLIIGAVGGTGTLYAVGYMGEEYAREHLTLPRYGRFFCLFDLYLAAMLSANMLTLAVYAILRFKIVTDRTVGPEFAGILVAGLGLLSLTVAAIFLLVQRDFKRLGRQCRLFAGTAIGVNVAVLGSIGLTVPPGMTVILEAIVKLVGRAMELPW